jgi:hypothetical protein
VCGPSSHLFSVCSLYIVHLSCTYSYRFSYSINSIYIIISRLFLDSLQDVTEWVHRSKEHGFDYLLAPSLSKQS